MAVSPYHLTSNGPRKNTLVVDLANVPSRKVNMDFIAKFVHQNLKIQFSNIRSLQHNSGKSLVFLECQTEDQVLSAVDINDGKHEVIVESVKYAVGVYMEDGATTVRIHDVSPQSENSVIKQALQKYGDVIWLKEETYTEPAILKGIISGVRAARIKMHTAIPSYINICGEVTLVTYKNQQQTCRHCNKPVHWGRKCMEVSYMEMQLQTGNTGNISDRLRASGVNYAGALIAGNPLSQQASSSTVTGKERKSVNTSFTNLTQMFRKTTPVISEVESRSKTNTFTNITNSKRNNTSEHNLTIPSKCDEMETSNEQENIEIPAIVTEDVVSNPTIPLNNSFEKLIFDDDMNDAENTSVSPSRKRKSRPRKSSK